MSKKVYPIKVRMMLAEDVPVGKVFTMNGVKYIKLSDDDGAVSHMTNVGVLATTVYPLDVFNSLDPKNTDNKTVEERAVEVFMAKTKDMDKDDIITYCMPDADNYRLYYRIMYPVIKGRWYVDNGVEDVLNHGDYLYIDEFCELHRYNEYVDGANSISRQIGVRAFYAIDPDALVTVRDCDLEGTYRHMAITNQEAVERIRWNNKKG